MRVNEIFASLQGEGPDACEPAVFLRLQGCNLKCSWCDTLYALGPTSGSDMQVDTVFTTLSRHLHAKRHKYVIITGGEPLLQLEELRSLLSLLLVDGCRVAIETNGTIRPPDWWRQVTWDVDWKCPSAKADKPFSGDWLSSRIGARIKLVVADETDLNFVRGNLFRLTASAIQVLVSPMIHGDIEASRLWLQKVWQFCIENDLRYSLQQHKIVFGNKRGV